MRFFALPLLALIPAMPAFAQSTNADSGVEAIDPDEILVLADRYPGEVNVAQPPLLELDEEDIASYGASSLSELLDALSPETSSGRGRGGGFCRRHWRPARGRAKPRRCASAKPSGKIAGCGAVPI